MDKGRMEAFSDGVIAIIITIMVLGIAAPEGATLRDLLRLLPAIAAYAVSFVGVGTYWNNHHHLFQACDHVSGRVLWANLHLLFWLSLFPFVTGWMGENHFAAWPAAVYGVVLLMAALAYWVLQKTLIAAQGEQSLLQRAVGRDWKGKLSPVLYVVGIGLTLWQPWLSLALYVAVALLWLVPDRRIERSLIGH